MKPEFVDPSEAALLHLGETLLGIFRDAVGKTRSELETETKLVMDASPVGGVIARGFEKLLLDRVEFESEADEDLIAWRGEFFRESSRALSSRAFDSVDDFRRAMAEQDGQEVGALTARLFSDLPENQPVKRFRSFSAERLLHRYNAGLVQWLLLHSQALTVTTREQDTKAWRQFFRHMRFHQLLAEIRKTKSGQFKIRIDGPLSLFQQTKKYGLSLAAFFPALLHLHAWKLEAEIHLRRRKPKRLVLDEACGIRPYSGQFLAHIPEEISLFQQLFDQQESDWALKPGDDFHRLPGDAYGFPDFAAVHASGRQTAIELFHPWHGGPLKQRLQQVISSGSESASSPSLLIGVDRKLAKDDEVSALLESSPYFQEWGFVFRDMPSPKAVLGILAKVLVD